MDTTITITYHQRAAARAGAERFWLAAHIQTLPDGHPVKRVVAFMALYARDVLRGDLPGPYSDERARTFARLALVDPDTWAAHHTASDEQLATLLELPLDEIPAVRRDQAPRGARSSRDSHEPSQDRATSVLTDAQTRSTRPSGADVPAMKTIQIIEHDGRPAALVAGDEAIIATHLTPGARARVQAKALYAIQIRAGTRPGPYTDAGADAYADRAAAHHGTRRR